MSANVSNNFAAPSRVTYMHGFLKVEMVTKLCEVVSVMIHVVAVPGLARPPMAPPVMGNAAEPLFRQEDHLIFPRIGTKRPAVAEHQGLSLSPILVVDLRAVLGCEGRQGVN